VYDKFTQRVSLLLLKQQSLKEELIETLSFFGEDVSDPATANEVAAIGYILNFCREWNRAVATYEQRQKAAAAKAAKQKLDDAANGVKPGSAIPSRSSTPIPAAPAVLSVVPATTPIMPVPPPPVHALPPPPLHTLPPPPPPPAHGLPPPPPPPRTV
jgi:hypothetical protein